MSAADMIGVAVHRCIPFCLSGDGGGRGEDGRGCPGLHLLWVTMVDANSWNERSLLLRFGSAVSRRDFVPAPKIIPHLLFGAHECVFCRVCVPGGRVGHDWDVGLAAALSHEHVSLDEHDGSGAI